MLGCACLCLMSSLYCKCDEDLFSECAGNMILSGTDKTLKDTLKIRGKIY